MRINPIHPQYNAQAFVFPSNLQSIDTLEILLDEIKEQFALSEHVYSSIWVCLNEAITNAIIHGNCQDITKKVHLSVQLKWDNFICFTIRDEGDGFDHDAIPDPTSPDLIEKPNGRGIFLMRKLADLALYSNHGTTVDLYFDLTKP
jgi:serine/threonine-protein kinase RsbW